MPYNANAEYRAELTAALEVLEPQIRGLHDLIALADSDELATTLGEKLAACERRRALIDDVLQQLDEVDQTIAALLADGYPDVPKDSVSNDEFSEMEGDIADMQAAFDLFRLQAERIAVSLGNPAAAP